MACDATAPAHLRDQLDDDVRMCGDGDPALGFIPLIGPFVTMGELAGTPVSVWPRPPPGRAPPG